MFEFGGIYIHNNTFILAYRLCFMSKIPYILGKGLNQKIIFSLSKGDQLFSCVDLMIYDSFMSATLLKSNPSVLPSWLDKGQIIERNKICD